MAPRTGDLSKAKRRYDPDNVLHLNQYMPPA
jgi:hypothetical protein